MPVKIEIMDDQKTMVEKHLSEMGLAGEWYVVRPLAGDIKDEIILQKNAPKAADVKTVSILLSYQNLQNFPRDKIQKIIRSKIDRA